MVGALWTGISGLSGQQRALDNESNNIANVNTIGYKSSRISFEDQMYQQNIGKGVSSFEVEKLYTQGNLKVTGVSYDMALSGDGFFQVSDGNDFYYTRAGNFRMGENGELQNVGKMMVQGWAMAAIQPESDVISTNENIDKFTSEYSKLLGNQILRNDTDVTTKVAKATDYTETAATDSNLIFSGAGYKLAASKISDVEELITEYNTQLTLYANTEPKPASTESKIQRSYLDFNLNDAAVQLAQGDEMYVYIDGTKYSQSFDTDEATTVKKLVDKLSNITGMTAYMVDSTTGSNTAEGEVDTQDTNGSIMIDGIVPGRSFNVSEFGWTDASNANAATKGTVVETQSAVQGTGLTCLENLEEALADAVSGKQMDVYPADEIGFDTATAANNDFTYQIIVYDKDQKKNVTIPTTPLTISDVDASTSLSDAVQTMVDAINADTGGTSDLSDYVKAYNINGQLVIKTLDKNSDVEFAGSLQRITAISETQTLTISSGVSGTSASEDFTFLGHTLTVDNSAAAFDTAGEVTDEIIANNAAIIATWNAANPTKEILSITQPGGAGTTDLLITYANTEGDVDELTTSTSNGVTFSASTETLKGAATGIVARNASYSTREGAGAEFLSMTTKINQTGTKSDIQLRLDTLNLTDSAFGDFSVDETGLITMKQDGAEFAVGQVAIARFTDNRGLEPTGDNLVEATNRSGAALFNTNNEKTAEVNGGTVELSTSDLSTSLVNLMVFQRAFEANSKSITTADQILTTLIQMKSR